MLREYSYICDVLPKFFLQQRPSNLIRIPFKDDKAFLALNHENHERDREDKNSLISNFLFKCLLMSLFLEKLI